MIIIKCSGKKIEWVLKKYRQKVDQIGQINELKSRKEFEKPSVKKRKQTSRAKYNNKKRNAKL
jgi:small subunit ribosomal protein S21